MKTRRGLTLLEVILSIAILGTALATIGQLIKIGGRNAIMARDLSMAQIYAETTLNEVACGAIEPTAGGGPLDDLGEWIYDLQVDAGEQENMLEVKVTVSQDPEQYARPITFSMSRWIIDPVFIEEAAAKEVEMKALFAEAQKAATATPMSESTGTDPAAAAAAAAAAPGSLVGAVPTTGGQGGQGGDQGGKGGRGGKGGEQGDKTGRGGKGGEQGDKTGRGGKGGEQGGKTGRGGKGGGGPGGGVPGGGGGPGGFGGGTRG